MSQVSRRFSRSIPSNRKIEPIDLEDADFIPDEVKSVDRSSSYCQVEYLSIHDPLEQEMLNINTLNETQPEPTTPSFTEKARLKENGCEEGSDKRSSIIVRLSIEPLDVDDMDPYHGDAEINTSYEDLPAFEPLIDIVNGIQDNYFVQNDELDGK